MTYKVKVSVLMAVYNTDIVYVKRAIDSVLNQDFQSFELIILDDGSSAEISIEILKYAEINEDKIVYIRHSNRGQAQSINRGVLMSLGEYISILDSDDEYKPQHLSSCLKEIKNLDLIASTAEAVVDSADDYYVPDRHDHKNIIHIDDCILFGTLFGKKCVFEHIKFINGFAADADFYQKAQSMFSVRKVNLRTYIYYRNMPGSISSTFKKKHTEILVE
jgi:glycosyltransferase involved in cell wall biosynthesis